MDDPVLLGRDLPPLDPGILSAKPDWEQCDPRAIQQSLKRALARPSGGWFVLDASRAIGKHPRYFRVDGRELVAYRLGDALTVAAHACPHMGGPLASGRLHDGSLVCPWHGLELPHARHEHWRRYPSFDDGVLSWVRIDGTEEPTSAPILAPRPEIFIDGVIRKEAACEPSDVIANRLDPWHGAHYHPHTFARLKVTEVDPDRLVVRVAYRLWGRFCIEVDAAFHSPEPRTIVMTIVVCVKFCKKDCGSSRLLLTSIFRFSPSPEAEGKTIKCVLRRLSAFP